MDDRFILIVDDEAGSRETIEKLLDSEGLPHSSVSNGKEALDFLNSGRLPSAILLDWNMPVLDGIGFLKQVKITPSLRHIPIVMQTANSESEYLITAIQEGVFYFLVKPFEAMIFKSIVRAAIREWETVTELLHDAVTQRNIFPFITSGELSFRTIHEAETIASWLSLQVEESKQMMIRMAMRELMINAVEHGLLGITYDEKTALLSRGEINEEIQKRMRLAGNLDKKVTLRFERKNGQMQVDIIDPGSGFLHQEFMSLRPERFVDCHGNGIAMARINLISLEYIPPGNHARAVFRVPSPPS